MGLSGAILSARKVSPAIRAKTGAATRLPKCWPARGSSMEIATIMRGADIGAMPTKEARYFGFVVAATRIFVRRACFAARAIAWNLRQRRGALRTHHCFKHATDLLRGARGNNLRAVHRFVVIFEDRHRQQLPIARKHRVGAGNLKERDGNAIAVGHRGLFNAPPAFPRAQPASDRARKMNMRRLAEAD